jgi:hypothetical protein
MIWVINFGLFLLCVGSFISSIRNCIARNFIKTVMCMAFILFFAMALAMSAELHV